MKKIKLTLLFVLTFAFNGCEDAIDITQPGRLTPDVAFQTVDDLEAGLYGVYSRIDLTPEIAFAAEYTDEVAVGFASGGQGINTGLAYELNPGSAAAQVFWQDYYAQINAINRVLEAAENVEPEDSEAEERKENVVGQLYALRAYAHFQLLSYYSTDYTDENALAVPILDYVPSLDDQPLRATNGEVFAFIESDLEKAESLITIEENPILVSDNFITALRARKAAYRRNYDRAAAYAKELLAEYELATREEFEAMWLDEDNTEVIFKLDRTLGDAYQGQGSQGSVFAGGYAGNVFAFTNATAGGGPYYEFGRSLFNLFNPDDIRYEAYLAPSSTVSEDYRNAADFRSEDILVIQKYPGSEGQPLMNDIKVFRISEMLLILAEAYAAQGNINGPENSTAALIKKLHDARFGFDTPLPVYDNQTEAFADILEERRIEFAFEGHRWKDLKRLGERAGVCAERDPLDCEFNGACTLCPDDYRFTLPIPLAEFDGNPGLREQQNPGY